MRNPTLVIAILCLLSATISSQNIIKNGDFENGTTSWTASGGGQLPGVTSFNVNGLGASNAYGVHADRVGPHVLSQNVAFINNLTYEITMDLTQTAVNGNAQGVAFEVYIGGKKVADWTKGSGAIATQTTDRERLCARVLVNWISSFATPFDVHFIRPNFAASQRTPRGMVDNIDVRIATDPIICTRGERKLGGTLNLEMLGTANAKVALFIAPTNMAPVSLPGFPIGQWELKGEIPILFGTLDGSGLFKQSFPIPSNPALDGAFVWWQGVAAIPTLSLGPAHKFGIYK
jgi:Carbohydrate binding domain